MSRRVEAAAVPAERPSGGWARRLPPRTVAGDRLVLGLAALVFVVAFGLGLRAVPGGAVELTAWPFVVLAVGAVPLASVANAAEHGVASRVEGHPVAWRDALEVAVLSSAANLLPVPGAAIVRVRALRRGGSSYRRAFSVTLLVGGAWLATSLVAAGVLLLVQGAAVGTAPAATVLAAGSVGLVGAAAWTGVLAPAGQAPALGAALLGAELLTVAVAAARLLLVLRGLGLEASVEQAVSLTVAGVVASAVGIVPGGLGLREVLAGAIAGLVGLPAATGVLAAAVDRLVGLPVLAALAGAFAAGRRTRAGR